MCTWHSQPSYRENASGGRLTFARRFAVGILITLISSVCYVASWEIIYFKFMPDFADKYAAHSIEKAKNLRSQPGKNRDKIHEAEHFREIYRNPAVNVAMTFMEVFP